MPPIHPTIYRQLQLCLGSTSLHYKELSGGSINKAFQLASESHTLFCKINSATKFPHLFEREAAGLSLLEKYGVIKTPKVIDLLEIDSYQALLLEWIEPGSPTPVFWKTFGEQLAALHAISQESFGLNTDNYMGAVPQINSLTPDWSTFFIQHRLEPLVQQGHSLQLLTASHLTRFHKLYDRVSAIFDEQPPAFLHGDLWSGNFMCTQDQQPVLIDPAVYFGHRSIDLGMTTLFGGFDKAFYEAYHYHYPFPANYKDQWAIGNLYPLLVHLLLFGKSYLASIERTLNDFQ
jgi:protein-ribulosamine 3-kinase